MKFILFLLVILYCQSQSIRVIALRVDFVEDQTEFTTGNGKFNLRQADPDSVATIIIDPPPHNRLYFEDHLTFAQNYFSQNLDTNLTFDVYPVGLNDSYHLPQQMAYYNPNLESDSLQRLTELYTTAYNLAQNDGVNINPNDIVIIFHAGTGNDVYLEIDFTPHDIPSISFNRLLILKYYPNWESLGKSTRGIILPETASQEGFELAINGLLVANIASQIGLYDLVDPIARLSVAGPWALEDRGLFNANGLLPSIPSAVNRYLLGLFNQKTITIDIQSDTLLQLDSFKKLNSTNPQIIKIPINDSEFYLLENRYRPVFEGDDNNDLTELIFKFTPARQQFYNYKQVILDDQFDFKNQFQYSSRGVLINTSLFDAAIPHSGILIWHLDQKQIDANLSSNRINKDKIFRGVRFLEADGIDNINQNIFGNQDERNDVFYQSNEAPIYQNRINSNSLPATVSNYEAAASGLEFYDFSVTGETMSFRAKRSDLINKTISGDIKFVRPVTSTNEIVIISSDANSIKRASLDLQTEKINTTAQNSSYNLNLSDFKYIGSSYWAFNADSVYEFNETTLGLISKYKYEDNIKQLIKLDDGLFVLLDNRKLFVHASASSTLFTTGVQTAKELQSKVLLIDSLNKVNELRKDVGIINNVGQLSDYYLESDSDILAVHFTNSKITATDRNGTIAYNYPLEIPYKFLKQDIIWLKQLNNLLLVQDSKSIVKLIEPSRPNTAISYFLGSPLKGAKFLTINTIHYLVLYSKNRINVDRISPDFVKSTQTNGLANTTVSIDDKRTFLWPNPNLDQTIHIRVFSAIEAIATARIFNETGHLFETVQFNTKSNQPVDYQWTVSDVPSGTYIILLDVNGQQKILKAAVVH